MTELARRYRIDGSSLDLAELIEIGQFFKNGDRRGEQRLMLAVLQDAVECFQENVWDSIPGKAGTQAEIGF